MIYKIYENYGKHCFVTQYDEGRLLKVFNTEALSTWDDLDDFMWGGKPGIGQPNMSVSLVDATKIQNYCWMEGLAPRVYDIIPVMVGKMKYWAQVVDDLGTEKPTQKVADNVYQKVAKLGEKYGWENEKNDVSIGDVREDKLIDFNTFHFNKEHKEKVKHLYEEAARYGKIYYHNVPDWNLKGSPRKNRKRTNWMKLDDVDFKEKSVMDIGCAGGFFCCEALDRGASEVLGIDYPGCGSDDPIYGARILANEFKHWSVDFEEMDLRKDKPPKADIVFFLSLNFHIGIPPWLHQVTNKLCIFEDNSKERDALPMLKKRFKTVRLVGHSKEHGNKPIYHCFV